MKTFQQPLSAEEEQQYLQLMRGVSEEAASQAKDILIERNLRLVAHIAKKYYGTNEDMDDLISIGTIGLIKAVQTFDYQKGSRLATYAARCIDNELLMMFRAKKKTTKEVSLYEPIGTDKEGNEIHLLDICVQEQMDVADHCDLQSKVSFLTDILQKTLDRRENMIISMRYGMVTGEEMTQREIGQQLHISRSYVSRIEKKALKKLKSAMQQRGFSEA